MAEGMFYIEDYHVKSIFNTTLSYLKPTPIARSYGIDVRTFKRWISTGEDLLAKNKDLSREIMKVYHEAILEVDEAVNNNDDLKEEFLLDMGAKELNYKNKGFYNKFLNEKRVELVEKICYDKENELIDKHKFHHEPERNKNIKNIVKFSRGYNRAFQSYVRFLLENVKNGVAQPKNVNAAIKWAGLIEPEEFNENVIKTNHEVSDVRLCLADELKNAFQMVQQNEIKQIEQKDDYIDADYER